MNWQTFFDMGGYAAFVWPAYGLSAIALIALGLASLRDMWRSERLVDLSENADNKR